MDKSGYEVLLIAISFLGVLCFFYGYFSAKANPFGPGLEKNDSDMTFSTEETRRRYQIRRRIAIQAIHYKRDGIFVFFVSLTVLIVLLFVPDFVFPNANVLEKMDDLIHTEIKAPWGKISIIGLIGMPLLSLVFFRLGVYSLKTRRDYFRALFFWALGSFWFLWGVFQWGRQ